MEQQDVTLIGKFELMEQIDSKISKDDWEKLNAVIFYCKSLNTSKPHKILEVEETPQNRITYIGKRIK